MTCKHCRANGSHGNQAILDNENCDIYIVDNKLYTLIANHNITEKVVIIFCPMCGRKL